MSETILPGLSDLQPGDLFGYVHTAPDGSFIPMVAERGAEASSPFWVPFTVVGQKTPEGTARLALAELHQDPALVWVMDLELS